MERQAKIEKTTAQTEGPVTGEIMKIKAMEFLSISQTATLFGISRRTIYRLINRGNLNIAKFGTRTVIKKCDMESFFDLPITTEVFHTVQVFPGVENSYTITEIQQKFNISPAALYNKLQLYGIAKYVIGRFTYIAKEDINLLFYVK